MSYEAARRKAGRELNHASVQRTRAMARLRELALDIARTEALIRKWDRRVKHYFERTQMTDGQLEESREKRTRRRTAKRGIKV